MNLIRALAAALLLLLLALPSWPQAPARIALIWPGRADEAALYLSEFRRGMHENGLTEGKEFVLDQRFAEGRYERFPALVDEMLKRDPAIIMVVTIASVQAAQRATRTVPIVFVSTNDPVGSGLVDSLARPGGNSTGLSNQNEDLVPKYLQQLRETLPRASRIAVLSNPGNASNPKMAERVRELSAGLGIAARVFEASSLEAVDAALGAITQHRPDGLLVLPDAMLSARRDRISEIALRNRFPVFVASAAEIVATGMLMSYGTRRSELYFRAANYVKKILGGARPGELPVEQPTRFELIINMRTARALGLTIPQALLLRADEVIE